MKAKLMAIALAAAFPLGAYAQGGMTNQPSQQERPGGATSPSQQGSPSQNRGQPGAARLDINRDGLISREEAKASPELNSRFNDLDRNRDGALSAEELSNAS